MYNIMIIDDEQEILKIIKRSLNKSNKYNISTYINPLEALEHYNKNLDLILIDIMMPQMNGFDLIDKIKEINQDQKILAMTAYSSTKQIGQSIHIDDKNYITKPFESMEYLEYKILQLIEEINYNFD